MTEGQKGPGFLQQTSDGSDELSVCILILCCKIMNFHLQKYPKRKLFPNFARKIIFFRHLNMTYPRHRLFAGIILLVSTCPISAQTSRILGGIATLRTEMGGRLEALPVLRLGTDETMEVSFDEMSHDYHRFVYRLEHLDRFWQPSDGLFFTEYADATQTEVPIEDYTESRNVTTLYTHYSFAFPNADMRPLVSGNYRLTILADDDELRPVAEVHFCMAETAVGISGEVTTDTETDYNAGHQQVKFSVDCTGIPARDYREDIYAVVLQNDRWDNAVCGAKPTTVTVRGVEWDHQRALVFPAGNEYRKFEQLSPRYAGLNVESVGWFDPWLHATIATDEIRRNYLTYEDQNGTSVIRNTDNMEDATETEYMITHFALHAPEPFEDARVYLNGRWTTGGIAPQWELSYNAGTQCYEGAFVLKQGYYDYQYLVIPQSTRLPAPSAFSLTACTEGDFYQTENDYRILVYYSQPGARYDRLVGTALLKKGAQ